MATDNKHISPCHKCKYQNRCTKGRNCKDYQKWLKDFKRSK
nr:MAG TPA: RNA polymerase Rpc34 subunit [Caudoviricetes sp.]